MFISAPYRIQHQSVCYTIA